MADGRSVVLAAIAGAHGITGEVRLKLFAEGLDSLRRHKAFVAGGAVLTLRSLRDGPHGPIARFAEIADRNAAEALRATELAVSRDALPPPADGEIYVADLIGLPALADGVEIGSVVAVENYGAGDLVEVERASGTSFLVPFARCTLADGAIAVDPAFIA